MLNKFAIKLIEKYQKHHHHNGIKKCRFTPTCSQYGKECYERFNFFKASILLLYRFIRCNPFHKIAYDPTPENKSKYKTFEETIAELNK